MNCLTKSSTLALIFLITLSSLTLLTPKSVNAQETATPSVPEFTLKFVDRSYDVPPQPTTSISTDPDTGDPITTTTTVPGYHVYNKTIEITIKNQQFTPYYSDGSKNKLYYNFSYRGEDQSEWDYYQPGIGWRGEAPPLLFEQSSSEYTVVEIVAPASGDVEVRVRALIGRYIWIPTLLGSLDYYISGFEGKVSSWSSPQTINIPSGSTSDYVPTPTPIDTVSPTSTTSTDSPTSTTQISGIQSENSVPMTVFLLVVVVLVAIVTVLLILVLTRDKRKPAL
jgi:hypothetical protein